MIPPEHHQTAAIAATTLLTAILVFKTDRLRPVVLLFGTVAVSLTLGADASSLTGAAERVRGAIFRALP